jgi:hypothetical protein
MPQTRYEDMFWYAAPVLTCHGNHQYAEIPLPYADLPQTNWDEWLSTGCEGLLQLPPDDWRVTFGCLSCGLVDTYGPPDVSTHTVLHQTEGRFHSGTNCYCAELQCGKPGCGLPAKLYIAVPNGQWDEKGLASLLRMDVFHGQLPCDHNVSTFRPRPKGVPYRAMNRLW